MMSLSDDKQDHIIDSCNATSRCMDGTLNIKHILFDNMVRTIYTSEL